MIGFLSLLGPWISLPAGDDDLGALPDCHHDRESGAVDGERGEVVGGPVLEVYDSSADDLHHVRADQGEVDVAAERQQEQKDEHAEHVDHGPPPQGW